MALIQPDSAEAQLYIGEILLEQGNDLEAIVAYWRVIQLAPQNPEAYFNLGVALEKRDRIPEAIAAIEKARELYLRQGKQEQTQQAESLLRKLKDSSAFSL